MQAIRRVLVLGSAIALAGVASAIGYHWARGSQDGGLGVGELAPVGAALPGQTRVNPHASPSGAGAGIDAKGRPIVIQCSVCHSVRTPNPDNASSEDLDEFHQGLVFSHGSLRCLSCHNADDYTSLRLASGSRVEFPNAITMCAQCHADKVRDYEHGAHGGMTGYWDLSRGGRVRNACIDCHDPHAPAFPHMTPTFKPIDRFLTGRKGQGHE